MGKDNVACHVGVKAKGTFQWRRKSKGLANSSKKPGGLKN
jgi:hypothetical protein